MEEEWWKEQDSEDSVAKGATLPLQVAPPPPLSTDQDFLSEPLGMASRFSDILFHSVFIFCFGGTGTFSIVMGLSGGSIMMLFFGLIFLIPAYNSLYSLLKSSSTYQLRVQHSTDSLVIDGTFLGRTWGVEKKILSDSLYLRYHKYNSSHTDGDGHTSTFTHHDYNIHGNSDEGDWKLDITKMMRGVKHPNDQAGEIAKSIGIKFETKK